MILTVAVKYDGQVGHKAIVGSVEAAPLDHGTAIIRFRHLIRIKVPRNF